jgi:hypothetical protein
MSPTTPGSAASSSDDRSRHGDRRIDLVWKSHLGNDKDKDTIPSRRPAQRLSFDSDRSPDAMNAAHRDYMSNSSAEKTTTELRGVAPEAMVGRWIHLADKKGPRTVYRVTSAEFAYRHASAHMHVIDPILVGITVRVERTSSPRITEETFPTDHAFSFASPAEVETALARGIRSHRTIHTAIPVTGAVVIAVLYGAATAIGAYLAAHFGAEYVGVFQRYVPLAVVFLPVLSFTAIAIVRVRRARVSHHHAAGERARMAEDLAAVSNWRASRA